MKTMVSLVGAGVGSWDMITLRGLRCIQTADCLIYDRLLDEHLLDYAPAHCEKLYVGKAAGVHYMKQDEINDLLVKKALEGGHVIRLKGGDPYVFGRGGEEVLRLRERNIPFQVVPGVTSAIAGSCFAGIPVTHREVARSFHVVTAHTKHGGFEQEDYPRLAALEGTLVLLMGLSQTEAIAEGLMACGKDPQCPTALVSCAGMPEQKTVQSTLEHLAEDVRKAGPVSPAIIVIGPAVGLRNELNFFEARPLFGKKILLTHRPRQEDALLIELEAAGARVVRAPMIELRPRAHALDGILAKLDSYTHIVLTSTAAVDYFMDGLFRAGLDVRSLSRAKLCVIGKATARHLRTYGLQADFIPEEATAEGLAALLSGHLTKQDNVLLPQASLARPVLRTELSRRCMVDQVELYDTLAPEQTMNREEFLAGGFDAVVFASSSSVRNFHSTIGLNTLTVCNCTAFAIGPVSADALRSEGIEPIFNCENTFSSMAETMINHFREDQ